MNSILSKKKYFFITLSICLFTFYFLFLFSDSFKEIYFDVEIKFNLARNQAETLYSHAFETLNQHYWLGQGNLTEIAQNTLNYVTKAKPVYNEQFNNLILILREFGILGLIVYLALAFQALLINFRLLKEIPTTHIWHRVFAKSTMVSLLAFHLAGIFYPVFFMAPYLQFYIMGIGVLIYFDDAYGRGIVPDDSSL